MPTTHAMTSGPGVSRLIAVASKPFPRYSEADVIELADGRLLLALARKNGSSDFSPGTIIGLRSSDGGLTWDDEPAVIQDKFDDVGDVMSVSFSRSPRGVHLFFLGRGPDAKIDTRVYQMLSSDEGKTWSKPEKVSDRKGYHVVNNARVIRTTTGRMIVPAAFFDDTAGPGKTPRCFRVYCLLSDDDGRTWSQSDDVVLADQPLMEPGVAQCGDGSIYMTIRTKLGVLYEARSRDNGQTWIDFGPSKLPSPAAPSTVVRDPTSDNLWVFWINRPGGTWKQRNPLSLAISRDHGKTWGTPREIESDSTHGFGYVSVTRVKDQVLLTYYDWRDAGQRDFLDTNLRQRIVPLDWFREKPVPPVFRARPEPVLKQDQPYEGRIVSANSGLLAEKDRWRLWYTAGGLGPKGEQLNVCYAESQDQGITWQKEAGGNPVLRDAYHASAHRDGDQILLYAWRASNDQSGLSRWRSVDDGKTFALDPDRPLIRAWWTDAAKSADGRVSNDAFDIARNDRGTWEYFAATMEKAADPRAVIKHDNAAGWVRLIGRAASGDGVSFSAVDVIIRPDPPAGDPPEMQFYGMQVFRRRKFYLGLLHVFHVESQIIQPEWAWSHDGQSWTRTRLLCISLGDEGGFDSRMIVFGSIAISGDELVWLYAGSNWRHNAFKAGEVSSAVGRATLPLKELDAWLDTLPQP